MKILHRAIFCSVMLLSFVSASISYAQEEAINKQINALGQDTVFQESWQSMSKVIEGMNVGLSKMSTKDRFALITDIRQYNANFPKSTGRLQAQILIERISAMSGVTQRDIDGILNGRDGLIERHPILRDVSPAMIGQALFAFKNKGIEYNLRPLEDDPNSDPEDTCNAECEACMHECYEIARKEINRLGLDKFVDLIMEPSIKSFISWFLLPVNIHEIQEDAVDCSKACKDWGPGYDCQSDADCEEGKYCHKSLGNPVNRCYSKKHDGWMCTGDRKCESGCCKFHFPSSPVTLVCRPADKCN